MKYLMALILLAPSYSVQGSPNIPLEIHDLVLRLAIQANPRSGVAPTRSRGPEFREMHKIITAIFKKWPAFKDLPYYPQENIFVKFRH